MKAKNGLTFEWDRDIAADGYIVKRQVGDEFIELVRIENIDLTTIMVPDVAVGVQNHLRVCFYKKKNRNYIVYKEEDYYCFVGGRGESKIYKLPIPKLKKAYRAGDSITIQWDQVSDEATYLVIRKTSGEKWARAGITKETSYTDKSIDASKKYIYSVRCVSEDGKSILSGFDLRGMFV